MANTILTIDMITKEAVSLFKNSNAFIQSVNRQYDDQFARTGAKIGTTLRIRLPSDYTVRNGPVASVQDTTQQQITMTVATQRGVDVSFNSVERAMQLDEYSELVLAPMVNNLGGDVAATIMGGAEGGVANFVANLDAANNIINPIAGTFLSANAYLMDNSAPQGNRKMCNDPWTDARAVATLSGLFNPQEKIGQQYATGMMRGQALGFQNWMTDQTILKHTSGSYDSNSTVNGAGQTGTTLAVNAITGTLVAGDLITIANVFSVNRVTKQTTGKLRQFAVLADVANGGVSISIYPAIIPAVGGNAVQYQTVDASPANAASVDLVSKASEQYRYNLAFAPEAITIATADLELPEGVWERAREQFDGISMRMLTQYQGQTDQALTRLDVLFGFLYVRPEWIVAVADSIN